MDALIHESSMGKTWTAADDYLSNHCDWSAKTTRKLIEWILGQQIKSGYHRGLF